MREQIKNIKGTSVFLFTVKGAVLQISMISNHRQYGKYAVLYRDGKHSSKAYTEKHQTNRCT